MKNNKKTLFAILVLGVFPLTGQAEQKIGIQESSAEDISISGNYYAGICNNANKTVQFTGSNILLDLSSQGTDNLYGVWSRGAPDRRSVIKLGDGSTEEIKVKVSGNGGGTSAVGMRASYGGILEVTTKNLNISGSAEKEMGVYGVQSQGNGDEKTSLVINSENTTINVSSNRKGDAAGLVAMSSGTLIVNGNLSVKGDDAIVARGFSKILINEKGDGTVKLDGNIKFDFDKSTSGTQVESDVLVNLSTPESAWKGNAIVSWRQEDGRPEDHILAVEKFKLLLQNGATWTPNSMNGGEYLPSGAELETLDIPSFHLNDGVINLTERVEQKVEVVKLEGSGGVINSVAKTDGSSVEAATFVAQNVEGTPHLTVNAVGLNADKIDDPEKAMQSFYDSALAVDDSKVTATMNIAEGDVSGALVGQVADGVLSTTEVANTVNTSLIDIASSNYLFFRSQINDVSARLGDLRSMPKTAGAWVRYYGGENKYSGKDMKEKYHTLQIGADKFINDNFYLGGTFSYTKGDGTLANGSTDDKNFNFGIYGGWMGEKGQFVDVIIKRHRLKSDFDLYSGNGVSSGNFHNWATSASVEAGWRFNCPSNGFYAEPQVELQVGHVDSANYTTSRGVKVKQKGIDSVIGRAGVAVGYSFPENKGNAYAMASVLHDWKGEVKSTFANDAGQSRTYSEDLGGTWGEFALGGSYNPTKNVSAYGQFKTSTGSPVRNPWQVSVGLRYNF